MRVAELAQYVEDLISYPIYMNDLPPIDDKNIGVVRIFPNRTRSLYFNNLTCQVSIQNEKPSQAEVKAWEIYEKLRVKTKFYIGSSLVLLCRCSQPTYLKVNESGDFLYQVDFQLKTEEVD